MYYDERDNHLKYKNEENKQIENNYKLDNDEHNIYNTKDYDLTNHEHTNYEETNYDINKNEFNNYENNYKSKEWDTDIKIGNINVNNFRAKSNELFSNKEGLDKGNMFASSYVPYKNYIYKVVVSGDRDKLLLNIQELTFKMIDLGLYLDVYPNDSKIYEEFRKASMELKKAKEIYEKNYGPLCLYDTEYYNEYKWNKNPWPWMNEGGKY